MLFAKDADAIITQYPNMPADFLDQLTNCKVISRYGVGYDKIDLAAAKEKGIAVTITPGATVIRWPTWPLP